MSIENKNIDDLFRERFENFEVEPPAHIWENVKAEVAANNGGTKGGKPFLDGGMAGLSVVLITIGILSFYLLSNSFTLNNSANNNPKTELLASDLDLNDNSVDENIQATQTENEVSSTSDKLENSTSNNKLAIPETRKEERRKKEERKGRKRNKKKTQVNIDAGLTNEISEDKISKSDLSVDRNETSVSVLKTESETRVYSQTQKSGTFISLTDNYQSMSTSYGDMKKLKRNKNDYFINGTWKLGLYFTPEMIVYPSDDGLKNYSNTIELNTSYHTNNLIFQTGVGVSMVTDEGDNHVDYRKYLGSYDDVYDVSIDEAGNVTYYTNSVDVYDSIASETISPTKRKFTYLQIPALFGYGNESRRFGWFVKGGPSLLLLIDQNIPESNMSNTSDMVINSENSLPGRTSANWQFIMSAGVSYKLGNKISISVEPMFRYYINSAYENSKLNTKHPYSIGLRTGLLLNL